MGSDDEMPGSGDEREEVSFSPQIQSTFFTHTLFPPFDDMRYLPTVTEYIQLLVH